MKKIFFIVLIFSLVACSTSSQTSVKNTEMSKNNNMQDINPDFTVVESGSEIKLATLNLLPIDFEEYEIDNTKKGVAVKLTITNTTKNPFQFEGFYLKDSHDRAYPVNENSFNMNDNLWYRELSPDIPETGYMYFIVAYDSTGYWAGISNAETGEAYKVIF